VWGGRCVKIGDFEGYLGDFFGGWAREERKIKKMITNKYKW